MKMPQLRTIFAAAVAAVAASAPLPTRASTFSVGGSGNTFIITRSGEGTNATETVRYRTVVLSAYAGQNFNARSGTLTFAPGETAKTNTVPESNPANGWRWQEFDYTNAHLYAQKFLMSSLRAEKSGSLVLPPPSAASTSASTPQAPAATTGTSRT